MPPGATPYAIVFSRDGNFAYVTSFFTNSVLVLDLTTNSIVKTIGVGTFPAQQVEGMSKKFGRERELGLDRSGSGHRSRASRR